MANIIFVRTDRANLNTVDRVDGQLIYTRDSGEAFYDVGSGAPGIRFKVSDVEQVANISTAGPGRDGKLYINEMDNAVYIWNGAGYVKAMSVRAAEVPIMVPGMSSTNVRDAIIEMLTITSAKVDKTVAGVGEKILKSSDITPNGNGFSFANMYVSLEDGATELITLPVTLAAIGAASQEELATLESLVDTKAGKDYTDSMLDTKVDKGSGEMVKTFIISPNPTSEGDGMIVTISYRNIDTGETTSDTVTHTAAGLGLARLVDLTELAAEVASIRSGLLRYDVDFQVEFGHENPNKASIDHFFELMGVVPTVGTSVRNSNSAHSTYQHVFAYFIDESVVPPTTPPTLKIVDIGVDSINIATATMIGAVRGGGQIGVQPNGDMYVNSNTVAMDQLTQEVRDAISSGGQGIQEVIDRLNNLTAAEVKAVGYTNVQVAIDSLAASVALIPNKMDKVLTAGVGNVAVFNSAGQVIDGGPIPDITGAMRKVVSPTAGNILITDSFGQAEDSGKNFNDMSMVWQEA